MRKCPPKECECYLPALGEYPEPVSGREEDPRAAGSGPDRQGLLPAPPEFAVGLRQAACLPQH